MKKLVLIGAVLLLMSILFAVDYAPGNVVFKSDEAIKVVKTEPYLETDRIWFNSLISQFSISNLTFLSEELVPDEYQSDRLYYLAIFDTINSVSDAIDIFNLENHIFWSEPNYLGQFDILSNDEYAGIQWNLDRINLQNVWNLPIQEFGDPEIIVAVLDSGVDLGLNNYPFPHPDLNLNLWLDNHGYYGWNPNALYGNDGGPWLDLNEHIPQDKLGHGTAVSGVIAASNNNIIGISSIAGGWENQSGCRIMPVEIGDARGINEVSVYRGLLYAYRHQASVINMSFHLESESNLVYSAISDIYNNHYNYPIHPIMVVSAGNDYT